MGVATSVPPTDSSGLPGPFSARRGNVPVDVPGTFWEYPGDALVMFQRSFIFSTRLRGRANCPRGGAGPKSKGQKCPSGWTWW